jgi:hypothetical protein
MRMNKKLNELKNFLIFEGVSWLERWGDDVVLYVNDTFYNDGYTFDNEEIEYVKEWIYKKTGGY